MLGMRQKQVPKIRGLGFLLQILDDLGHLPGIARAPIFLQFLVVQGFRRIDMVIHELGDPLLQIANFLTVRKIHGNPLN